MLKKMKLKPYLLTVFSIIIVLSAIMATIAAVGLMQVKEENQYFVDHTLAAESAVKTCRVRANIVEKDLREMIMVPEVEREQELKGNMLQNRDEFREQLEILKESYVRDDGLVERYENAFNNWTTLHDQVIKLVEAENDALATKTLLVDGRAITDEMVVIVNEIFKAVDEDKAAMIKESNMLVTELLIVLVVVFIIVLVVSIFFAVKTAVDITRTTNEAKDAVVQLSKGNLSARFNYDGKNEFGELAERMNFSFRELSSYIEAIDYGMVEFSKGNFTTKCPKQFIGDFANIQKSMENFQAKMNDTLLELDVASGQVSAGANQVADGAQALAQGATEQASSVQELSAAIAEIAQHISQTAEYSEKANVLGKQAGEVVEKSKVEMKQMMAAIKDIASDSVNIQRIIKAIDDIAFQTNILALNAAVEAARAGNAGKGFAVVADEVRNLAQKSAEAAKDTTELIENSLKHIAHGEQLAASTDVAFEDVARYAGETLTMVSKIAEELNEQAIAIPQISQGVDQISSVVQMNSATSEESAAASEELSGQAGVMKSLIDQFELTGSEKNSYNYGIEMPQTTVVTAGSNAIDEPMDMRVDSFDKY